MCATEPKLDLPLKQRTMFRTIKLMMRVGWSLGTLRTLFFFRFCAVNNITMKYTLQFSTLAHFFYYTLVQNIFKHCKNQITILYPRTLFYPRAEYL